MKKTEPIIYRFFIKIKITKSCWLWQGAKNELGYGYIKIFNKNKHHRAHRFSWETFRGKIPKDMYVLHRCDTPSCVNPKHLFLGTLKQNSRDMMKKGRGKNQFKRGQKFPYKLRPWMIGNNNAIKNKI